MGGSSSRKSVGQEAQRNRSVSLGVMGSAGGGGGVAAWGEVAGTLSDQIDLQAALDAKSASNHNHDADYDVIGAAAAAYAAAASDLSDHEAAANPHPGYLTSAEGDAAYQPLSANLSEYAAVNPTAAGLALLDDADNTAQRSTLGLGDSATRNVGTGAGDVSAGNHTHPGGSEALPIGAVFIAVVDTDPATLLGYGTWSAFGAGRVLVGRDSGDTDFDTAEETGGAKTQTPSAHAGTAVADHAAHTHSVTSNVSVDNHASHTHTYTEVPNHVHSITSLRGASTGGATTVGSGLTTGSDTSSTAVSHDTLNPTGGVANGTTAGPGAALTHTTNNPAVTSGNPSATLTHSVTQPNNHSAMSVVQPYIVVYMWKRTA